MGVSAAGIAACTSRICLSSVAIGINFAQRMMITGITASRTTQAVVTIFQEGFSVPTRSMIVAPVIMIASGKAPMPSMEIATRGGPVTR